MVRPRPARLPVARSRVGTGTSPSLCRIGADATTTATDFGDDQWLDDAPRSIALATWALFVGLALLLAAAGLMSTLMGVRAELEGFGPLAIGLLGAGYYGGFLLGSRVTLSALGDVGHIRVYTALASLLVAAILAAGYLTGPTWWVVLRFGFGICLGGQYVVAESWLHHLATNRTRASLLSIYTVITVVGFGSGQLLYGRIDPLAVTGFAVAAILSTLAVAPVALSEAARPPVTERPHPMKLAELWRLVPTGVIASVLVGITHGAFLSLIAVYLTRAGVGTSAVAVLVAMPTAGNLLLTVPISYASDRIDRRVVGAIAAAFASVAAIGLIEIGPDGGWGFVLLLVIGGATYPLYAIAGAYTSDQVRREQLTAAASQLVLLYGAGALAGPLIGSFVMNAVGTSGFAWTTLAGHVAIAGFFTVRVVQYPSASRALPGREVPLDAFESPAVGIPATAVGTGRRLHLTRRLRNGARRARPRR